MKKLNENSPIPLYFQLQEDLKRQVDQQIYTPGQRIPTEKELEKIYGVSRITVRKAVEGLVFEGILVKRQGIGTTVARKKISEESLKLKSFTEKMAEQDIKVDTVVLEAQLIEASSRIAKHLDIGEASNVLHLKRLRLADDEPIAVFSSYIPLFIGLSLEDDLAGSLFDLLENKYNVKISHSDRIISASRANSETAELLGIDQGEAVIIVSYKTMDEELRCVEYAEGVYRSDKYQYRLRYTR